MRALDVEGAGTAKERSDGDDGAGGQSRRCGPSGWRRRVDRDGWREAEAKQGAGLPAGLRRRRRMRAAGRIGGGGGGHRAGGDTMRRDDAEIGRAHV